MVENTEFYMRMKNENAYCSVNERMKRMNEQTSKQSVHTKYLYRKNQNQALQETHIGSMNA